MVCKLGSEICRHNKRNASPAVMPIRKIIYVRNCGRFAKNFLLFTKPSIMVNYTAKYTKIDSGYMGQLVEWPEVITEGKDLEECRAMLKDTLHEMLLAYKDIGKEIPLGNALIEQLPVEVEYVSQTA